VGRLLFGPLKIKKMGFWVGRREGYPLWLAGNEVFVGEMNISTILDNNLLGHRLLFFGGRLLFLGFRSLSFGGRLLFLAWKRKMTYVREGKGLT
jgi:hypothetical protein